MSVSNNDVQQNTVKLHRNSVLGFDYGYAFMGFILIFHTLLVPLVHGLFVSSVMFSLVYCLILYSLLSFHWSVFD